MIAKIPAMITFTPSPSPSRPSSPLPPSPPHSLIWPLTSSYPLHLLPPSLPPYISLESIPNISHSLVLLSPFLPSLPLAYKYMNHLVNPSLSTTYTSSIQFPCKLLLIYRSFHIHFHPLFYTILYIFDVNLILFELLKITWFLPRSQMSGKC